MKQPRHKQTNHRKRGRPPLSATVCIEPVYAQKPSLERLAQILEQHARNLSRE